MCLLRKALYGLKQAPRAWYHKIHMFFISCGFYCSHADSNLYVLYVEDAIAVLIILYVDDLTVTGSRSLLIDEVKVQLSTQFEMTDLGVLHYYLGIKIWQSNSSIFISQMNMEEIDCQIPIRR